jgi:hypothetical protein
MKNKKLIFVILINWCFAINMYAQKDINAVYHSTQIEKSKSYINGNKYQKDFLLFIDMIKNTHPLFSDNIQHPFNVDNISRLGYKKCSTIKNQDQFSNYVQSVISKLRDGHTSVIENSISNQAYPFFYYADKGKFYLKYTDKKHADFLGKEIIAFNGIPLTKVLDSFRNDFSYENETRYQYLLGNSINFLSYWKGKPFFRPDSTLTITFADNTNTSLRPTERNKISLDDIRLHTQANGISIRNNLKTPFLYIIDEVHSICYLQFNECDDQITLREKFANQGIKLTPVQEQKISNIPRFDTFLKDMFSDIKTKNIKTLVIDVRDNGGGNSKLCDELLSWLKPINQIRSGSSFIRISDFAKQQYPYLVSQQDLFKKINLDTFSPNLLYQTKTGKPLRRIGSDSVYLKKADSLTNTSENNIFRGNIIFIQNEQTFSSAGMLITGAVDNNIGLVIGTNNSFSPNSCGDILYWKLPNTNIRGSISHKLFARPDINKINDNTIKLYQYIRPSWKDFSTSNDNCWQWILEKYGK